MILLDLIYLGSRIWQVLRSEKYGSDVIVDVIRELGVPYVTLNPGSTTRGLHDSIVNYGKNKNPQLMLCCHEEVAVSIAAGYFRATNKPLVVLLHDLAGLLHAPRAILDAWQHRDGLIILGGNGPLRIENRRAGTDWNQIAESPNLVVRSYTKWDSLPYSLFSTAEAIAKGYAIASTKPAGPVYIAIDTDVQEDPIEAKQKLPPLGKSRAVEIGEGGIEDLKETARLLAEAENPVFVTGRYGKSDESVDNLVKLAEEVGAAVLAGGLRCNFPSDHPLNLNEHEKDILPKADVIVAFDVRNLFAELSRERSHYQRTDYDFLVRPEAKIITVDAERLYLNSWMTDSGRSVPVTKTIIADGSSAVRRLVKLCAEQVRLSNRRGSIADRVASLTEMSTARRKIWFDQGEKAIADSKINYPSLSLVLWRSIKDLDWVVSYVPGGISSWIQRIWSIRKWYQYPGIAGGTGCGIGRAIGSTLANRGRFSINFETDGDLLYSPSGLWTIAHFRIPMLIVMANNHSYFNDERHQHEMAVRRGRPVKNKNIGIRIEDPYVNFSEMASAYGLKSSGPIDGIASLKKSVREGIRVVAKEHRSYLLDTVVDMGE